jgi:aryl-alcohol dehydrogenase-like predicted oxidoreductase
MTAGECYRFVLSHPRVDTALCGARTFEELADDVAAVQAGPLSPARMEEIKSFGDAVRASATGRLGFLGS